MRKRTLRDWILRDRIKKKKLKREADEIVVGKIA